MQRCIYCLKESEDLSLFNREHVIPEAFGTFGSETMVLSAPRFNRVCIECNTYFGNNVDIVLAKDTLEGYLRFDKEVQSPEEMRSRWRGRGIEMRYMVDGTFKGAIVRFEHDESNGKRGYTFVPQVGFRKKGQSEWIYLEPKDIKCKDQMIAEGYDLEIGPDKIRTLGVDEDGRKELYEELLAKGIKAETDDGKCFPVPNEKKQRIEITETIDKTVCRGMAKILFNYFAYHDDTRLIFCADFDPIRDFIRRGEGHSSRYIEIKSESILFEESKSGSKMFDGHMLCISWRRIGRELGFYGYVSLFNVVRFRIRMCENFRGIFRPLEKGHAFCIHTKTITEIRKVWNAPSLNWTREQE